MSDNYLKISYTAFCRSVYIFCNGNNDKVDRHLPDGENNKIWKRKGCEKMGRKRKPVAVVSRLSQTMNQAPSSEIR